VFVTLCVKMGVHSKSKRDGGRGRRRLVGSRDTRHIHTDMTFFCPGAYGHFI
jgi:hypothetical protein